MIIFEIDIEEKNVRLWVINKKIKIRSYAFWFNHL